MTLVASLALRAGLIPVLSLILITGSADWEGAFIASNKKFSRRCYTHIISANLTDMTIDVVQWLRPIELWPDDNEFIPVVGARNKPCISLHF